MRRGTLLLACLSLVAAACGGSDGGTSATVATSATSAPVATASTEASSVTIAPSTPVAPTASGALVPEALCVRDHPTGVYFAYDNQSDAVVEVADGTGNRLDGAHPLDEPFRPTVFAPGRVSPAFLAYPVDEGASPFDIRWEVTGPDGRTRSAAADESTPACTADLLQPTTPDPRTPVLEVSVELNDARDQASFTVRLTGVPSTSVCNAAFTPEPATIRIETVDEIAGTRESVDGTTATFTAPVYTYLSGTSGAVVIPRVVVADRCSFDGATFSAWPAGAFADLISGTSLCYSVPDSGDPEVWKDGCSDLPPTGGLAIRNG